MKYEPIWKKARLVNRVPTSVAPRARHRKMLRFLRPTLRREQARSQSEYVMVDESGSNEKESGACGSVGFEPAPSAMRSWLSVRDRSDHNNQSEECWHRRGEWGREYLLFVIYFLGIVGVAVGAYVAKSALGINLFDGHSILHSFFF